MRFKEYITETSQLMENIAKKLKVKPEEVNVTRLEARYSNSKAYFTLKDGRKGLASINTLSNKVNRIQLDKEFENKTKTLYD